jgi:hypothetical protein
MDKVWNALWNSQVRGIVLEDPDLKITTSRELHRTVIWNIQPLVTIDAYGVRLVEQPDQVCVLFRQRGKSAKSRVDVQPEVVTSAQLNNGWKIVKVNGI